MARPIEDLLRAAQAEAWAAAPALPEPGPERLAVATDMLESHYAAWPTFGRHAIAALRAATPPDTIPSLAPLIERLTRATRVDASVRPPDIPVVAAGELLDAAAAALRKGSRNPDFNSRAADQVLTVSAAVTAPRPPDPHVMAAGELLRETAATLRGPAGKHEPNLRPIDQILAVVATVSTFTTIAAEQSAAGWARPGDWVRLTQAARRGLHPEPTTVHPFAVWPEPVTAERTLATSIEEWHRAAVDATASYRYPPPQVPHIALMIRRLYVEAAATGGSDQHTQRADAWKKVTQAWHPVIQVPGTPARALIDATRTLLADLKQATSAGRPEDLRTLHRYVDERLPDLAFNYANSVRSMVANETLTIPAARLVAITPRPVPVRLAAAARRHTWVPLPADSAPAVAISEAATLAVLTPTAARPPEAGPLNPAGTEISQTTPHEHPTAPTSPSLPAAPQPHAPIAGDNRQGHTPGR